MRFLLLSTFLFFFISLVSQTSLEITKVYTVEDGLCSNIVTRVREDSRGFLWIGTWEGLNRFDGQEFRKYFHQRSNSNSLPHNLIYDILEYQPGMLLIATPDGLGVLNTITGQFENEKIEFTQLQAGSNTNVTKIEKGPEGNIWVIHSGMIDVLDQHLKYLYRFTDLEWAKSIQGISMYLQDWVIDPKGRIWVPSDSSGIVIIDLKAKSILSYKNNPDNLGYFSHRLIRSMWIDGDSILWLSQWGEGLMKYSIHTGEKIASLLSENENSIPEIMKLENGNILLGGRGDVYELNPFTLTYSSIPEYGVSTRKAENKLINSVAIHKTKTDIYWLGAAEGLFKLNMKVPRQELDLINEPAWNSNSRSWFSNGKMYLLGGEKSMLEINRNKVGLNRYTVPTQLSINYQASIAEDFSGNIWIGGETGLRRFDPDTKSFDTPSYLPDVLKSGKIRVIFRDRDGYLWVSMADPLRLFRISTEKEDYIRIPDTLLLAFSATGPFGAIELIEEDENGNLWMASNIAGGILYYDKAKSQWTNYPESDRNKDFLGKIGIKSMWPDTAGNIWLIRPVGDGIVHYNYRTDSISVFTREDGLPSNDVLSIALDGAGHLWVSTPYGISRFSLAEHKVTGHFTIDFSSRPDEYNVSIDPYSQELILAGSQKMIWVDPKHLMDPFPPPDPILDEVMVNREIMTIDPSNPTLNLNYTQKNISIAFTAINFSNTEKLQFAYTLSGEEDEWTYTTTSRIAQYSFLTPGKYVFKVKVSDGSAQWSESADLLSFTIEPPFWRKTWFLLTIGFLFSLALYALVRRRIANVRHEEALKQRVAETEMMALRAQMNPHFIFNCINSIDSLIQSNDKYNATVYLNKFARLIRNILDSSKMNNMILSKDLETLKLYIELEQLRNENKFTAQVIADPSLLQGDYKVPPLVIQPYVENAIIHGLRNRPDNEGKLAVSVARTNGYIQYIIEDNGVGRKNTIKDQPAEKNSYGMEMSSERIRLFNQEEHASVTITDLEENGDPKGTRIEVLLKMI